MQTRPIQYFVNTCRGYVYPWVYGDESFEANEIVDKLWLGDWSSAYDVKTLEALGITHILSAVYDISPAYPEKFTYMNIPVIDREDQADEIRQHFDQAIKFIQKGLSSGSVLVHCVFGVSRSSTLVCAYLMNQYGMNAKDAVEMVKAKRPQVNPNQGFLKVLESQNPRPM